MQTRFIHNVNEKERVIAESALNSIDLPMRLEKIKTSKGFTRSKKRGTENGSCRLHRRYGKKRLWFKFEFEGKDVIVSWSTLIIRCMCSRIFMAVIDGPFCSLSC